MNPDTLCSIGQLVACNNVRSSGVLIGKRLVLTTAHGLKQIISDEKKYDEKTMFSYHLFEAEEKDCYFDFNGQEIKVEKIYINQQYHQ